jgi:hypothetical protein
MRTVSVALLAVVCFFAGCDSNTRLAPPQDMVRTYNGTAAVGDFLTIYIDPANLTITYKNYTNGETGAVPYTVGADGTYTIADPNGNLLSAYEVPGTMLMVEALHAGPNRDTASLITAIESAPASISTFAGRSFNYLQFRTSSGGVELGTITVDALGNIQHDGYWPFGVVNQQSQFSGGSFPASSVVEDSTGNFFTINESNGSQSYAFGTQNGFFAVDTENGTILGLPKAAAKAFDPVYAGHYTAIFYQKAGAQTGPNNVESGTPLEAKGTINISAGGLVTIADSQGNSLGTGALGAIADTPYIYNGNQSELTDPLYGMFTFRTSTAGSQQDVFVSFQSNAVIFSSFQVNLPVLPNSTYTYFYGVGLK